MRQLASIQTIKNVFPIEGADRIEMIQVLGWQCVAKKDEFKAGDMCVYFEVDSYLPIDERFEFLRASSYRNNEYMGEGFRIRTQKFRGCISQGLALHINLFPEIKNPVIGTDVSETLGIRKWEMPEVEGSSGTIIGDKPFGVPTTDETRVQSIDELRKQLIGKPYYISTKMDGTSCSMYFDGEKFGVCGRNNEFKNDGKCSMWSYAIQNNIEEKMRKYGRRLTIQGEFCGHGIQKNRLRLTQPQWYVFNIIDMETGKLLSLDEMLAISKELGLTTVPIEEVKDNFQYTLEELIERAKGKYPSGLDKEGIVVRPQTPEYCEILSKELSFKVLNNDFLVKEK